MICLHLRRGAARGAILKPLVDSLQEKRECGTHESKYFLISAVICGCTILPKREVMPQGNWSNQPFVTIKTSARELKRKFQKSTDFRIWIMQERKFKAGALVALCGVAGRNASWELKDTGQATQWSAGMRIFQTETQSRTVLVVRTKVRGQREWLNRIK